jgi:hypothetical protein
MINIGNEQSSVLIAESYCYPWQVLEADNETWIIMRWKERISSTPLSKICSVSLSDFSWNRDYNSQEKRFYCGEIALEVSYQEMAPNLPKIEMDKPWQEEYLFRKLLFTGQGLTIDASNRKKTRLCETAFAELLLEGEELKGQDSFAEENKVCKFTAPWRGWLKGSGDDEKPLLKKVHVAQIGLYTLMVEAVIKLETRKSNIANSLSGVNGVNGDTKVYTVLSEETMFKLIDDSVLEVIGIPVERAFWRYSYDAKDEKLVLENIKKTSLLYISAVTGGERILIASVLGSELITMKNYCEARYPAALEIWQEQGAQAVVDEKSIFYMGKVFCQVYFETVYLQADQSVHEQESAKADKHALEKTFEKNQEAESEQEYMHEYEQKNGSYEQESEEQYTKESEQGKEKKEGIVSTGTFQEESTTLPEPVETMSAPVQRTRPGEKWLKKQDGKSKCAFKAVMIIKVK